MKSYLERAEEYLAHLKSPKWTNNQVLTEEDKLEIQTAITVTSLMAMMSIASSLEDMVQTLGKMTISKLTDVVDYQALLEKYMKGVIDAESVSFSDYSPDLTNQEDSVLQDLAKKLGCGNQR